MRIEKKDGKYQVVTGFAFFKKILYIAPDKNFAKEWIRRKKLKEI